MRLHFLGLALALVAAATLGCAALEPLVPEGTRTPNGQQVTALPAAPSASPQPPPSPTVAPSPSPLPTVTGAGQAPPEPAIPSFSYRVVATYPHDPEAWTQGLVVAGGVLYEGTGRKGRSSLRQVDLGTGQPEMLLPLPSEYYGEGITVLGDRVYQLTWQSHIGFEYDRDSFELLRTFEYPTEGWGLTHDGEQLIMSDGTATLHFLDPETLEETASVQVQAGDQPAGRLNELEYIDGQIYANLWPTNAIALIDPLSAQVTGLIDLSDIYPVSPDQAHIKIPNGIAYDQDGDRLFVTGKLWSTLFEIELLPAP